MISHLFGRENRPTDAASWLIVGLGNPGREFERNRHNIGFRVMDAMAGRCGVRFDRQRSKGKLAVARRDGHPVYLLKPQTYVNASGQCVGPVARFFRVPPERVLIVCDDIDLPFGRIRVRATGSSGGHNGLKSIIEALGNRQDFPRIRFGVGRPPHVREVVVNHVLEDFSGDEEKQLEQLIPDMLEAIELTLSGDIERAMDTYNRRRVLRPKEVLSVECRVPRTRRPPQRSREFF